MRGEELTPWLVRQAYKDGAFPMGEPETGEVEWYRPRIRAVFPLKGVHVSHSLSKVLKNQEFEVRFDTAFERVMRSCLRPQENWITEDLIRVYTEIHTQGWAHSAEAWKDGRLAGGVYGLCLGSCFCAESMFHVASNASKMALWALVERCREVGVTLFDAQIMNPHLRSLGAVEVSDSEYMGLLKAALETRCSWDGCDWD